MRSVRGADFPSIGVKRLACEVEFARARAERLSSRVLDGAARPLQGD